MYRSKRNVFYLTFFFKKIKKVSSADELHQENLHFLKCSVTELIFRKKGKDFFFLTLFLQFKMAGKQKVLQNYSIKSK